MQVQDVSRRGLFVAGALAAGAAALLPARRIGRLSAADTLRRVA